MDPKLLETFSKLGIPINEQKRLAGVKDVAYDYVFDSESIATTFKAELAQQGIIFCSISEAVREYPDLVRKHLGSVVSSCVHTCSPLLLPRHCCMLAVKGHARKYGGCFLPTTYLPFSWSPMSASTKPSPKGITARATLLSQSMSWVAV